MSASGLKFVKELISRHRLVLFSNTGCTRCKQVEKVFTTLKAEPKIIHLDARHDSEFIHRELKRLTGDENIPKVFIGGEYFGNGDFVEALHKQGILKDIVSKLDLLVQSPLDRRRLSGHRDG